MQEENAQLANFSSDALSHLVKPLIRRDLSDTVSAVGTLSERVRLRLRDEKDRKKFSEREIADLIDWSQSKVAQKLSGRTPITLDELEALCFALGLPPTEVVRDHGLEFCAEMTPTELRILERIRQLPVSARDGLLGLLHVREHTRQESRGATKPVERIKTRR